MSAGLANRAAWPRRRRRWRTYSHSAGGTSTRPARKSGAPNDMASAGRAVAELDREVVGRGDAAAAQLDPDLVAGLVVGDRAGDVRGLTDALAVDADDHVALLDTRAGGRRAGDDGLHLGAAAG